MDHKKNSTKQNSKSPATSGVRKLVKVSIEIVIRATCLMVVIYFLVCGLTRFHKLETRALTKLLETRTSDQPYIAYTVCPSYLSAYNRDALESYGLDKRSYLEGNYLRNSSDNGWDVFKRVTYDIDDLLDNFTVNTISTKGYFVLISTNKIVEIP